MTTLLPIEAGPEMAALQRFHRDVSWRGVIEAGRQGPGSPRMVGIGKGVHRQIQDGRWIVADYTQDQFTDDGALVLTWQMHWVCGWSPALSAYVATAADNYGRALTLRGYIDGDVLKFETESGDVRFRLSWDASQPEAIVWRNEGSADGGVSWFLVEEYVCTPLPAN